jgi:hypothetical protein
MTIKVTLPHDPLWYALEWAVKNCPSYITNDAETVTIDKYGLEVYMKVNYYFSDQRDANWFALKWLS